MTRQLTDERLLSVAEKASEAFWAAVAEALPEIKTGDVDPFTSLEWDGFTHAAIRRWYADNLPADDARDREEREAEAVEALAEMVGHFEACGYTMKATTEEMAVHFALYAQNGGPLESCS